MKAEAAHLREALSLLPEQERRVIELRFGIPERDTDPDVEMMTLVDVGAALGLHWDAVRSVERAGLRRLQHIIQDHEGLRRGL